MTYPNPSTALASVVIDELARAGCRLVVAAPGSRSTALVLAAAAHSDLELVMVLDERSAGYQALGWAKASGRPGVVMTTSGTAVANLFPAVVEADAAGVALIVVSSDRPPELRGVGANQTIDQPNMFAGYVRHSSDLGPAVDEPGAVRFWRSHVSQALAAGTGWNGTPGPVHLNLAFREPTVGVPDDGRVTAAEFPAGESGRGHLGPWSRRLAGHQPSPQVVSDLGALLAGTERGLIIAGGGVDAPVSVVDLGGRLGWPVVATAESGLRRQPGTIATGHHLLGVEGDAPDLILRFGTPGPSRRLVDLVAGKTRQVVVGPTWSDPGRQAEVFVDQDPGQLAAALNETIPSNRSSAWLDWWAGADQAVRAALQPELGTVLTEPAVAATAGRSGADRLVAASSMPIRDLEAYAFDLPPLIANRGASGIDGLVSTTLGVARLGGRTLALAGDLSILHDSNGFIGDSRPDCVFVVVDNSGGGIFSFLPQAEHVGADFDRLFATPHERDLSRLAEFHEIAYREEATLAGLEAAVDDLGAQDGAGMVVVRTDRSENVAEHRRLERLALDAVDGFGPVPR